MLLLDPGYLPISISPCRWGRWVVKPRAGSIDSCSEFSQRRWQPFCSVLLSLPLSCACDGSSRQELLFTPEAAEVSRFHLWDTDFAGDSHRFIPCPPRGDTWRWLRSSMPAGSTAPPPALRRRTSWEGRGQRPDAPPDPDRGCYHKHHGRFMVANVGQSPGEQEALQGGRRELSAVLPGTHFPSSIPLCGEKGWKIRKCCRKSHLVQYPKGSQLLQKSLFL